MRGRVLAETTGKSPKPAKKNNHHETAYAALDWDIGPDTTAGVGYLANCQTKCNTSLKYTS